MSNIFNSMMQRQNDEQRMIDEGRLPPGQSLTQKFPVLHYRNVPAFNEATWNLRVFGEVETPMQWTWQEFLQLPTSTLTTDIHCVTRWSKFDTVWEGILFRDFVNLFGLSSKAKYVIAHSDDDYTTNVPLDVMLDDDVMLAYKFNGEFLEPDHGYPLRTVVPKRYFWKSAKWVRALEFSATDKPGYWENAGYHNQGDPWKEERYSQRSFFF